jgi:hypothetical protein
LGRFEGREEREEREDDRLRDFSPLAEEEEEEEEEEEDPPFEERSYKFR